MHMAVYLRMINRQEKINGEITEVAYFCDKRHESIKATVGNMQSLKLRDRVQAERRNQRII